MTLLVKSFVSHLGELRSRWGICRTVGQIHALLFVAERQLRGDGIGGRLGTFRSNLSIGSRGLQSRGLVRLAQVPGNGRRYFSSLGDGWRNFQVIATERRRGEVTSTLAIPLDSLLIATSHRAELHAQKRMREKYEIVALANTRFGDFQGLSTESISQLMKMGRRGSKATGREDPFDRCDHGYGWLTT
ncbi:DNA-binding transcriptional regulator GbsR, MarR family [Variovorax sp. 770b2]|nr:DNA-binding transcriptional regulator GbsR, MarR family [Variovorax sp. 770b2]